MQLARNFPSGSTVYWKKFLNRVSSLSEPQVSVHLCLFPGLPGSAQWERPAIYPGDSAVVAFGALVVVCLETYKTSGDSVAPPVQCCCKTQRPPVVVRGTYVPLDTWVFHCLSEMLRCHYPSG